MTATNDHGTLRSNTELPGSDMDLRTATANDAAQLAEIDVLSWRAAYRGLMPDSYLHALSIEGGTDRWAASLPREVARNKRTIVAERSGIVAGYATVGPTTTVGLN